MERKYKYISAPFNESLAPFITDSARKTHIYEHHCVYEEKLQTLVDINKYNTIEEIIHNFKDNKKISNLAKQIWNHNFFWSSIGIDKNNKEAKDMVLSQITFDDIVKTGSELFGSGWLWITYNIEDNKIALEITQNAEISQQYPILVIDLWEHAFYIDHQGNRSQFILNWCKYMINWEFAYQNIKSLTNTRL